jgi:hypothetical protein
VLVQLVDVTDDRRAGAEAFAQDRLDPDMLLDSPFVMLGSPSGLAEHLARLGEMGGQLRHRLRLVRRGSGGGTALKPLLATRVRDA